MEEIINVISHPATWAVLGILIKTLAPSWMPVLGMGKKLVEELTELHDESKVDNVVIKRAAVKMGKKLAAEHLVKRLS